MNYKAAMVGFNSAFSNTNSIVTSSEGISHPSSIVPINENTLQIIIYKLNGKNYLEWSPSVRLVIDSKGKLEYSNGEIKLPTTDDPKFLQWWLENLLVTAWLINSMEPTLGKPFVFLPTTRDVQEAIRETYSDLENHSQLYEINIRMWQTQQGDRDVTAYYNEMMILCQELDIFKVKVWESLNDRGSIQEKCLAESSIRISSGSK